MGITYYGPDQLKEIVESVYAELADTFVRRDPVIAIGKIARASWDGVNPAKITMDRDWRGRVSDLIDQIKRGNPNKSVARQNRIKKYDNWALGKDRETNGRYNTLADFIQIPAYSLIMYEANLGRTRMDFGDDIIRSAIKLCREFIKICSHEFTHWDLADTLPYRRRREMLYACAPQDYDWAELFNEDENTNETIRMGMNAIILTILDHIPADTPKKEFCIQRRDIVVGGLEFAEESLAMAIGGNEPDFSLYSDEPWCVAQYQRAYDHFTKRLETTPPRELIQEVKDAFNEFHESGRNVFDILDIPL